MEHGEATQQRYLSAVAMLELFAEAAGINVGRHRWEFVWEDGRLVKAWRHVDKPALSRTDVDQIILPVRLRDPW